MFFAKITRIHQVCSSRYAALVDSAQRLDFRVLHLYLFLFSPTRRASQLSSKGLAIRDYWSLAKEDQKDDKYIVLVVDNFGGKGNILNFNVGDGVKLSLPNTFWTRLSGKYGTTFFVRDNGVDVAVENAVEAIISCLRSEDGFCNSPPEQGQSLKSLGFN